MIKQSIRLFALSVLLLTSSLAFAEESTDGNVIRLSSTGEVKVPPNMASLTLSVTNQAKTANGAVKDNAKTMEKVVKALRAKLGKTDTLQTSQYQVTPVYQHDRDTNQSKLVSYRVTNQILIQYHDLASLGDLLDEVVSSGVNQIDSLRFDHSEAASLQKKALEQAIVQAKSTAELIAKSAGVSLKGIKEIASYDNQPTPVYREAVMAMDARGAASQVLPGEITISATVNVVYSI